MIYHYEHLQQGFDGQYDAIVVGSGPGGAVAALNLVKGGMKVAVVEAGAQLGKKDMTRNAPHFLAKYFWEGGLRVTEGSSFNPAMQGKALGGSSVMNSAIMFRLPEWVRAEWQQEAGLPFLFGSDIEQAYDRIYKRTHVTDTPASALGPRNLIARDVMKNMGLEGRPLPRAVKNCQGRGDCLTGCAGERKQSVDRSYIAETSMLGADVFTCSQVDEVIHENGRAMGVRGFVVNPDNFSKAGAFDLRAPLVIMAAGATHTPALLMKSGINGNKRIGATFFAHLGAGAVGFMNEVTDPWVGATQGWGSFDPDIQGVKYESLWAPESVITVKWGGIGKEFIEEVDDMKKVSVLAAVYRGKVKGKIKVRRDGSPRIILHIPKSEIHVIMQALKKITDGYLKTGARYVFTGVKGVKERITSFKDSEQLLSKKINARSYAATMNHMFGSCRMGLDAKEFPVDLTGRVRGTEGIYITDASIFPSPSAVNPQATIMALSELISRRLADFTTADYLHGRAKWPSPAKGGLAGLKGEFKSCAKQ